MHTNETTNYGLSQFIETDKPGWLTDYNSDMRKLDTALKGVSDVASGASGSVSSLTDRMTAAEGAITTSANDIDALEARADVLEAQAQSQAGTIAGIQTEQITQNAGIEAATELGYNLARPYDSASTYAVGDYVLFQNTLYKCVTAIATGEAFDPTKWLAIKATDEISGGMSFSNNFTVTPIIVPQGATLSITDKQMLYDDEKIILHLHLSISSWSHTQGSNDLIRLTVNMPDGSSFFEPYTPTQALTVSGSSNELSTTYGKIGYNGGCDIYVAIDRTVTVSSTEFFISGCFIRKK